MSSPVLSPKPEKKSEEMAACPAQRYEVTAAQLPLHCPMPEMALWNGHPRVFIPLKQIGDEYRCPYCSAVYILTA